MELYFKPTQLTYWWFHVIL